jgi:hypothetical protein
LGVKRPAAPPSHQSRIRWCAIAYAGGTMRLGLSAITPRLRLLIRASGARAPLWLSAVETSARVNHRTCGDDTYDSQLRSPAEGTPSLGTLEPCRGYSGYSGALPRVFSVSDGRQGSRECTLRGTVPSPSHAAAISSRCGACAPRNTMRAMRRAERRHAVASEAHILHLACIEHDRVGASARRAAEHELAGVAAADRPRLRAMVSAPRSLVPQ